MNYKPLYDCLCSGALRRWGLSQRAVRQLIKQADFLAGLPKQLGDERVSCAAVLELCRPVMDRLCPPPERGWLQSLYAELAHRLFPDPAHGTLPPSMRQAMGFYLTVLNWFIKTEAGRCPEDPLSDLPPVTEAELADSAVAEEYARFRTAVEEAGLVSLMRLGREIMPFDPASHTIGVHYVALHMARQAAKAGLAVDVPLVSAAALSHDVGKFGCRGSDAARIPYLHYYFTFQWLSRQGMDRIAHIAANHSTWDLEFENLSLESLLLIYADFRVRGTREAGKEQVRIYTLAESYDMIFSKLYDMTPAKQHRYQTVYLKLKDFEDFLSGLGVSSDPAAGTLLTPARRQPALCSGIESFKGLCDLTFENNVRLMHEISVDETFGQLLEQARAEKSLHRIRTYLQLFEEYSTYMTGRNKRRTLGLLYELLMHPQGDVRRHSARIMGAILANSGPRYRKELPNSAPQSAIAPAVAEYLTESVELWTHYMDLCLYPDHKISPKHAQRISNSLKIIVSTLVQHCDPGQLPHYLTPLLDRLPESMGQARFALLDALYFIPLQTLPPQRLEALPELLIRTLQEEEPLRVLALRRLELLYPMLDAAAKARVAEALPAPEDPSPAIRYLRCRMAPMLGQPEQTPELAASELYLSNLKTTVHWLVKLTQIEALCDDLDRRPENAFHTAMHLSNLLSVSEHLPVRERAGDALLRVVGRLPLAQQNEIIVDLLRELETGQDEISVYIPRYLGQLMAGLPSKELSECLDYLQALVKTASSRTAGAALSSLSTLLAALPEQETERETEILGLLLSGVCHYNDTIHENALTVLCTQVLASESLSPRRRMRCLRQTAKKLLTLLREPRKGRFTFFAHCAALNHLYRFLVQARVDALPADFPPVKPVAFFPGTFDPFTTGHRRIVQELLRCGFEVYLAIDEFSWSKHPIPRLRRRQIASMSTADLPDVYLFPEQIPVNIAYPEELSLLSGLFAGRELYLVTGSDVIRNASAYRTDAPGSAGDYNHIIFLRDEKAASFPETAIRGKKLVLSLPEFYETVSSTRIREYVDRNMDISMLVDPMVQSYIFEHNLYLHAPQYKITLQASRTELTFTEGDVCTARLTDKAGGRLLGFAQGRTLRSTQLYPLLESLDTAEYLRRHTSGRILLIDRLQTEPDCPPDSGRLLINELLARSLTSDHTYALCRVGGRPQLAQLLPELGFVPVAGREDFLWVDMRTPVVLVQDVLRRFKEPHRSDPELVEAVGRTRPRLRRTLAATFPGRLVLSFDAELLDLALMERIRQANGVSDADPKQKTLGPAMCVPYGKILSGQIVPNTVTKSLHVDKVYENDIYHFSIRAMPGYAELSDQVRTIRAFHRPVLLVDDLLHKGYRLEKLDAIFRAEGLQIRRILVGILSGRGKDLMDLEGRQVVGEYLIPNLLYWFTESLLYPFIGGDSMDSAEMDHGLIPTANLILPYLYPDYIRDVPDAQIQDLSACALENARSILLALEQCHQRLFGTPLTIRRLAEALMQPRAPYRGRHIHYELSATPSSYLSDDLEQFGRMKRRNVQ